MHTMRRTLAALLLVGTVVCAGLVAAGYADITPSVNATMIPIGDAKRQVLTDAQGMTLYYFTLDTATRSTCTNDCSKIWPPLLSASAPTSENTLPGKLTVVLTTNGRQVAYNGHLLYRYSGDATAGQANGQGIGGKWWVATVDLGPISVSTTPGPSGAYGGDDRGGGGGGGGGGMGGHY